MYQRMARTFHRLTSGSVRVKPCRPTQRLCCQALWDAFPSPCPALGSGTEGSRVPGWPAIAETKWKCPNHRDVCPQNPSWMCLQFNFLLANPHMSTATSLLPDRRGKYRNRQCLNHLRWKYLTSANLTKTPHEHIARIPDMKASSTWGPSPSRSPCLCPQGVGYESKGLPYDTTIDNKTVGSYVMLTRRGVLCVFSCLIHIKTLGCW